MCDGYEDCLDGSDEKRLICLNKQCPQCPNNVKCAAINSSRLDVFCEHEGHTVNCNEPLSPGTTAVYSCK